MNTNMIRRIFDFIPVGGLLRNNHQRRESMPMRYAEVSRKELKFLAWYNIIDAA
jgi:hypothetical protein